MFRTVKTDEEGLANWLNDLTQHGYEIYQILPSVEYDGTLYVIVYKEKENG